MIVHRLCGSIFALTALAASASAQTPKGASKILPPDQQIARAVSPAPADMRANATVFGYDAQGKMVTLRQGTGALNCLATDPARAEFHVACYHKSMEPFMARGRALRASGVKDPQVDTVRFKEVKEGKLVMPTTPAVLYTLTDSTDRFDATKGTDPKAHPLFVIYTPNATGETLGLTAKPIVGAPWVMYPGTPKAHVMFVPKMTP